MDIGEPRRIITVEPVRDPVPRERPAPAPDRQPAEPAPVPTPQEPAPTP
jgi:hypothetical protein